MVYNSLSPFFHTRYSDLLQALEHSFVERFGLAGREGSFVVKTVKGKRYWYFQFMDMDAGKQKPVFIGPDSDEIRLAISETKETREVVRQLSSTLSISGGFVFPKSSGRILASLGDSGLFLSGSVLVGTNAFLAYQNVFGIRWKSVATAMQTTDIDFAQFTRFKIGVPLDVSNGIRDALSAIEAHPVWKTLRPKDPPWTFLIRKENFSIEFLAPLIGPDENDYPVPLPWTGVHAKPLRFMDFLIEGAFHAVAPVSRSAILVNLPDPGRFALHKLIVHERRPAALIGKKAKDLVQAGSLISYLSEKTPELLQSAWSDVRKTHPTWVSWMKKSAQKLPDPIRNTDIIDSILRSR